MDVLLSGDFLFTGWEVVRMWATVRADERSVLGQFTATESSFHGIDAGDEIAVRYIAERPHISAPEDTLSIIRPIRKAADVDHDVG